MATIRDFLLSNPLGLMLLMAGGVLARDLLVALLEILKAKLKGDAKATKDDPRTPHIDERAQAVARAEALAGVIDNIEGVLKRGDPQVAVKQALEMLSAAPTRKK